MNSQQSRTIQRANSERVKLVPILGSGMSRPLGLPSWSELAGKLAPHDTQNLASEPVLLQHSETESGFARFNRMVSDLLTIPARTTTLALQILARANPATILTTNLDHALEQSFELAGQPLSAARVFTGRTDSEIRAFRLVRSEATRLLKLHGSVERPDTWVLTAYQYRDMYWISDLVSRLLMEGELGVPLFVGFGMRDRELLALIHGRAEKYGVSGYCIASESETSSREFREELRRCSLEPISYRHVFEIPKILQQIFDTTPPQVQLVTVDSGDTATVHIKASCLTMRLFHPTLDSVPALSRIIRDACDPSSVENAVSSTIQLISALEESETTKHVLSDLLSALSVFPEFFIAMADEITSEARYEVFRICKRVLAVLPDQLSRRMFVGTLINYLATNIDTSVGAERAALLYKTRSAIAEGLAQFELHPAQVLPPRTVRFGDLEVCEYPLTRWHVGKLFPDLDESWCRKNPIRPVTLGSKDCPSLSEILLKLSHNTKRKWRLPTVAEWNLFAFGSVDVEPKAWPWGNIPPTRYVNAGLNFSGAKQKNEEPPAVGLFPNGRSQLGLWDLIGTVYERVSAAADDSVTWKIAGCGYTTAYLRRQTPAELRVVRDPGYGKNTLGIRPVYRSA